MDELKFNILCSFYVPVPYLPKCLPAYASPTQRHAMPCHHVVIIPGAVYVILIRSFVNHALPPSPWPVYFNETRLRFLIYLTPSNPSVAFLSFPIPSHRD